MRRTRSVRRRHLTSAFAALTGMTLLAGCATAIDGAPVRAATAAGMSTAQSSAGPASTALTSGTAPAAQWPAIPTVSSEPAPSTDAGATAPEVPAGPTVSDADVGPLSDVPPITLTVEGATDAPVDLLAEGALQDLFAFYDEVFPTTFGGSYKPPGTLASYDSTDPNATLCGGESVYEYVNAFYSSTCDIIAWDRGVMLPQMAEQVGILAPAIILSHEVGHDVQHLLGEPDSTPTIVLEQQADCYAGAYWRWVDEGNSKYYAFNQTEGMRQLMLGLLAVKDPPMTQAEVNEQGTDDNHGSGFDRVYAATLGFTEGVQRCSTIDEAEINARLKEFPFADAPYQYGNVDITTDAIKGILGAVDMYFTETQPGYVAPTLTMYAGSTPPACDGKPGIFPVDYCASTNTVRYQLAELKKLGTPTEGFASPNGDFSAFILLVTRYALAALNSGHAPISGTAAGLQALCYAGTWANWMRTPHNDYQLSPNDLDKAIYQIILSPNASGDVSGQTDSTILERVQALGYGVTTTITDCFNTYLG